MSSLPGGTVTIPGLNPNDTLGSAILQALNIVLTVPGSTTSTSNASVGAGNQLTLPPVEGASSVVGVVTTSGVLNLANQPSNLEALVISPGDPATMGSGAVTVLGTGQTNFEIAAAQYTNLDFYTGGGSGTVNSGGGNNLLGTATTTGSDSNATSAWDFNVTSGNNTVVAASGNNTISMGTGNNLIAVSNGTDQITSTGDDTVLLTGGAATINVAPGGSDVIAAYNNASLHFVSESANPSTVFGTNTSADYISGGTVAGGGGVFVGGSGGNNTLISGQGDSTLLGGGNGDQLSVTAPPRPAMSASTPISARRPAAIWSPPAAAARTPS
jgi:serralysin